MGRRQESGFHSLTRTSTPSYYETQLVRAVESVLSPLDWDRSDIRRELAETRLADLAVFSGADTA